jgi:nucleoside-diphosphate-sugar epimerase
MKVLFIGGTGLISTACTKLAVERGIDLTLLNRGKSQADIPSAAKVAVGNIKEPDSVRKALGDETFDVVVNWIAFTPEDVQRDIDLFSGKCGQYIFISSASAYQKPVSHYLITESTPLANPYWQYSRNKIACEERLLHEYRDNGLPVTIVRPSLTYGDPMIPQAVGSWSHPWTNVDRMLKGRKIISHGDGQSLWVTTHNSDFAKGFVGLMGNAQTIGHAFHITTDEVMTWDQIYQTVGRVVGVEPKLVHIPTDFLMAFSPGEEGNLLGDKAASVVFDNSKIKRFVPEFVATCSLAEGVKQSVQWFRADPARMAVDEEYNALADRIIEAYESGLAKA